MQAERCRLEDPSIKAKWRNYKWLSGMQTSVPEWWILKEEPDYIYEQYGEDSKKPGTFASNLPLSSKGLQTRSEIHPSLPWWWDHHSDLPKNIEKRAKRGHKASADWFHGPWSNATFERTLVSLGWWIRENLLSKSVDENNFGRDQFPRCIPHAFSWAGVKKRMTLRADRWFGYM